MTEASIDNHIRTENYIVSKSGSDGKAEFTLGKPVESLSTLDGAPGELPKRPFLFSLPLRFTDTPENREIKQKLADHEGERVAVIRDGFGNILGVKSGDAVIAEPRASQRFLPGIMLG